MAFFFKEDVHLRADVFECHFYCRHFLPMYHANILELGTQLRCLMFVGGEDLLSKLIFGLTLTLGFLRCNHSVVELKLKLLNVRLKVSLLISQRVNLCLSVLRTELILLHLALKLDILSMGISVGLLCGLIALDPNFARIFLRLNLS